MATPSPKRRRIDDGNSTPAQRPSFMSPTKASLARFNPQLLALSKSPGAATLDLNSTTPTSAERTPEYPLGIRNREEDISTLISDAGAHEADLQVSVAPSTPALFVTPAQKSTGVEAHGTESGRNTSPSRKLKAGRILNDIQTVGSEHTDSVNIAPSEAEPDASRTELPSQTRSLDDGQQNTSVGLSDKEAESRCSAKQKERDQLLQELRGIRRELKQYEHHLAPSQSTVVVARDSDSLISLINAADPSASRNSEQPSLVSTMLASFLPFSRPAARLSQPVISNEGDFDLSHKPVDLEDPLPYLGLFTSLSCSEDIEPSPESLNDDGHGPFKELHHVTLHSQLKLLTVKFTMTTAPTLLDALTAPLSPVQELAINHLSPWASAELFPTIREHADGKDVSSLCNAVNTYWELSLKRAECWIRCKAVFPHLIESNKEDNKENDVANVGTRRGIRKSKRKLAESVIVCVPNRRTLNHELTVCRPKNNPVSLLRMRNL